MRHLPLKCKKTFKWLIICSFPRLRLEFLLSRLNIQSIIFISDFSPLPSNTRERSPTLDALMKGDRDRTPSHFTLVTHHLIQQSRLWITEGTNPALKRQTSDVPENAILAMVRLSLWRTGPLINGWFETARRTPGHSEPQITLPGNRGLISLINWKATDSFPLLPSMF